MGSYYQHTKKVSVDVPYSFQCEQCMKDSGPMMATIVAQAEINSNFKDLDNKKRQKLDELAQKNLVSEVKSVHRNATEKHIYPKAFKDICPYCGKPQTWALGDMKDNLFSTPIVCVIVSLIFAAGCYFFSGVEENLIIAIVVAAIGFAAGVVSLLVNIMKMQNKKKQTAGASKKNLPVIEWSAVQSYLNQ